MKYYTLHVNLTSNYLIFPYMIFNRNSNELSWYDHEILKSECFVCVAQNRKLGNSKGQHHNLIRQGKHK